MAFESLHTSSHIQHTFGPPSPFRCTQCNARNKDGTRNLIVCVDGASDHFGHNNTNVVKLFAKIDLESTEPEQFAYYSSGIGTRPESLHILGRMQRAVYDRFHMVVIQNMEQVVKDAYSWLAQMYREGDRIYLFGFSRGAYQVRVLAGMIHEVGLIKEATTEDQTGKAYGHYEAIRSGKPKIRPSAREFKKMFSWLDLKVHFIGVWDTVPPVGLIRGDILLSMSSSAEHTCHFRHALALDERRVKFVPDYFYEVNSQAGIGKSKYIAIPHCIRQASSRCQSIMRDVDTDLRVAGGEKKSPDVEEVWFAGSHSDVGGRSRPGEFRNAGHASLLWMRREAVASGLVLKPTDIVWLPDDLDSGISDSMSSVWRVVEYLPIKHQVSFCGAGEYALRLHRLQPRRIIPSQKVHASVLYANTYQSKATLGEGFDAPTVAFGDMEPGAQISETGLFDGTAAQELMTSLTNQQGVAPIYLDRLLFLLQFKEGKRYVRGVADWQAMFVRVITGHHYAPLVRLVAIVAYYEASCNPGANQKGSAPLPVDLSQDVFLDAKEWLRDILIAHRHQDSSRIFALLRPLTKHRVLREHILSPTILEAVVNFFNTITEQPVGCFGQAMDFLNCMLQCEGTRQVLIENLGARSPNSNVSRLSHILKVDDSRFLPATLRMVLTLAQIPAASNVCSEVKPRIRELASTKHDQLTSSLAVAILEGLDDRNGEYLTVHPGQQVLSRLFGLDARELNDSQKKLIGELKKTIERGNVQERTAAMLTFLRLCETATIRTYLREINILDVFVRQMGRKDSALLAAYVLATCMKCNDIKESIEDNGDLPIHIVRMLRLDHFDNAVCEVEGFQIFGDLMQHANLREKIMNHGITEILMKKLGKGKPKEIRTSLICLDIFRSFDPADSRTHELANNGLENLRNPEWKVQKAGVTILYALTQTEHGVAAISPHIPDIVEMLLPAGYLLIRPARAATGNSIFPDEGESRAESADSSSATSRAAPPRPPSWMMGPACALRALAQNDTLRDRIRETIQYRYLKYLFLSGALVDKEDTPAWHLRTPRRANVINMLYKVIMAVDDGPFERGLMSLEDAMPPYIRHWNRLVTLLHNRSEAVVTVLSALLGVPALVILAGIVYTPIYASTWVYSALKRAVSRYQKKRAQHSRGETNPATLQENDEG